MTKYNILRDNDGKSKRTRRMNGKITSMIDFSKTEVTIGGFRLKRLTFNDRMNRWIGEVSVDGINYSFCLWSVEGECCRKRDNMSGKLNLI